MYFCNISDAAEMKTKRQTTNSILKIGKTRNKPKLYSRVGNDLSGENSGSGAM